METKTGLFELAYTNIMLAPPLSLYMCIWKGFSIVLALRRFFFVHSRSFEDVFAVY